jgi:cystathionine beta-lyase/cystathionine gamma-synthase
MKEDTIYPRYLNTPNEKAVAEKIASLAKAEAALVFSARAWQPFPLSCFTPPGRGDHVVFQKGSVWWAPPTFVERELEPLWHCPFTVAASQKAEDLKACIRDKHKAHLHGKPFQSPAEDYRPPGCSGRNGQGSRRGAQRHRQYLCLAGEPATRRNLGIDLVVHSATKYMGGHSDILAGGRGLQQGAYDEGSACETGLNFGRQSQCQPPFTCWSAA